MDLAKTLTEAAAQLRIERFVYRVQRDIWQSVAERLAQRVVYCNYGISARVDSKEVQELLRATYELSERYVDKNDEDQGDGNSNKAV